MASTVKGLFNLIDASQKRRALLVLATTIFTALLDAIGVASILPFLAIASNPDVIEANRFLAAIKGLLGVSSDQKFVFYFGIFLIFYIIFSLFLRAFCAALQLRFSLDQEYIISSRVFSHLLDQNYAFFLKNHSSELMKNLFSEVSICIESGVMPLMQIVAQSIVLCCLLLILFIADPYITLLSIVFFSATYVILYRFVGQLVLKYGQERTIASKQRFEVASECFSAIKLILLHNLQPKYAENYEKSTKIFVQKHASAQLFSILPRFGVEAIAFSGILAVLLLLLSKTENFDKSLPIVGLFAVAGYRMLPAVQQIYQAFVQLKYCNAAVQSVSSLMEAMKNFNIINNRFESKNVLKFGDLRLDNISFSYLDSGVKNLDGINLVIERNSVLGLVGPSGSGKSTLVNVISGLLKPTQGSMFCGEQELSDSIIVEWQKNVGYVPQDTFIADRSLIQNIAFGIDDREIDVDLVRDAIVQAGLNEVVAALPFGWNTKLGESGSRLSGGQRQRIGIARALYRKPKLLILDESTSALDNVTQEKVLSSVLKLKSELTVIIIAHRFSTIQNCDLVAYLNEGRLIASGRHSDLMRRNDYRQLAGDLDI